MCTRWNCRMRNANLWICIRIVSCHPPGFYCVFIGWIDRRPFQRDMWLVVNWLERDKQGYLILVWLHRCSATVCVVNTNLSSPLFCLFYFKSQPLLCRHGPPPFSAFLFVRGGAAHSERHGLLHAFHGSLLLRYAALRECPVRPIRLQQVWISGECKVGVVPPGASCLPGSFVFSGLDLVCENLGPAQ